MTRQLAMVAATAIAALLGVTVPALCTDYYLATDVPATLGGTDYTPEQLLRSQSGSYVLDTALPAGIEVGAIHRRSDGVWIFSPSHPVTLGAAEYEPRDLVAFDGVSFALFLDGSSVGIPGDARIDGLLFDASNAPILSFDAPVNLGGTEFSRSDLVDFSGGVFSLAWDAQAAGVPTDSNLVGADQDSGGALVLTFDVPTNLGGTDYLPGQLVRWSGGTSFSLYLADGSWPAYAQLRDFSFVPAAGSVPDGSDGSTSLTVNLAAGNLTLSWGSSCTTSDTDYEVYEGSLTPHFTYTHTRKLCTTGGLTTATFAAPSGSAYYLAVPRNAVSEGSYGSSSSGAERPQGQSTCVPQVVAPACP